MIELTKKDTQDHLKAIDEIIGAIAKTPADWIKLYDEFEHRFIMTFEKANEI